MKIIPKLDTYAVLMNKKKEKRKKKLKQTRKKKELSSFDVPRPQISLVNH